MRAAFGTWEDRPYESIPKDFWMLRVTHHAQRLQDEARLSRRPMSGDAAHGLAVNLVRDEDAGILKLSLGSGIQ